MAESKEYIPVTPFEYVNVNEAAQIAVGAAMQITSPSSGALKNE